MRIILLCNHFTRPGNGGIVGAKSYCITVIIIKLLLLRWEGSRIGVDGSNPMTCQKGMSDTTFWMIRGFKKWDTTLVYGSTIGSNFRRQPNRLFYSWV